MALQLKINELVKKSPFAGGLILVDTKGGGLFLDSITPNGALISKDEDHVKLGPNPTRAEYIESLKIVYSLHKKTEKLSEVILNNRNVLVYGIMNDLGQEGLDSILEEIVQKN